MNMDKHTVLLKKPPPLIHAGSVNVIQGYLLKRDYLGEPGDAPLVTDTRLSRPPNNLLSDWRIV
jgi:hypothetical protein